MNTNKIVKINFLLIFIFFTQISPFIHWHAHEHRGEVDLRVSVHPPEFPIEDNTHDDHHDQVGEHEHRLMLGSESLFPLCQSINVLGRHPTLQARHLLDTRTSESSALDFNHDCAAVFGMDQKVETLDPPALESLPLMLINGGVFELVVNKPILSSGNSGLPSREHSSL